MDFADGAGDDVDVELAGEGLVFGEVGDGVLRGGDEVGVLGRPGGEVVFRELGDDAALRGGGADVFFCFGEVAGWVYGLEEWLDCEVGWVRESLSYFGLELDESYLVDGRHGERMALQGEVKCEFRFVECPEIMPVSCSIMFYRVCLH